MKFTIYVQDECDYCKEIEDFNNLDIEKVYINRDDFDGFRPSSVPVMQLKSFQLEGPYQINEFLKIVNNAKQDK